MRSTARGGPEAQKEEGMLILGAALGGLLWLIIVVIIILIVLGVIFGRGSFLG